MTAALLFSLAFVLAFVPFLLDIIEKAKKAAPTGPAKFAASLAGKPCVLEITAPKAHRLTIEGEAPLTDPGPGAGGGNQALWRLLDFYSKAKVADYPALLAQSGVDVEKRGLIRLDPMAEKVAVVVGANGETEPKLPQVAFERDTWRIRLVVMGDGSRAEVLEYAEKGWPRKISSNLGEITLSAPSEPAKSQRKP